MVRLPPGKGETSGPAPQRNPKWKNAAAEPSNCYATKDSSRQSRSAGAMSCPKVAASSPRPSGAVPIRILTVIHASRGWQAPSLTM
jgi:hypothetical protein